MYPIPICSSANAFLDPLFCVLSDKLYNNLLYFVFSFLILSSFIYQTIEVSPKHMVYLRLKIAKIQCTSIGIHILLALAYTHTQSKENHGAIPNAMK